MNITLSQVKVGDNINTIDAASILELESSEKALVITRVSTIEMNLILPLNGAMVYNTDVKCVFVFEGTFWKSLCNSEITVTTSPDIPLNPMVGDLFINNIDNTVRVWDGENWALITRNNTTGNGPPDTAILINAIAGDIYVDSSNGEVYAFEGTSWVRQTTKATNGINLAPNNTIELGGALTKVTEINTDTNNTIAITGLEEVSKDTNSIVTIEESTGILRKSSFSSVVEQEEIVIIATDNQNQFTPPLAITSSGKLNVYRNGVRLGFTVIDDTTIELESPVFCYQNDEIRIVQFR